MAADRPLPKRRSVPSSAPRPDICALLALLAIMLLAVFGPASANAQGSERQRLDARRALQVEAAYLINFLRYTEWPDSGRGAPGAPLVISVIGADHVATTVAAVASLAGPVNGRPVVVRDVAYRWRRGSHDTPAREAALEALRSSQLVFIDRSAARSAPRVVQDLRGRAVLTVSNVPGFVDDGGMLELFQYGRNIVFTANPDAIQLSGVLLSAKVLKLARSLEGASP